MPMHTHLAVSQALSGNSDPLELTSSSRETQARPTSSNVTFLISSSMPSVLFLSVCLLRSCILMECLLVIYVTSIVKRERLE